MHPKSLAFFSLLIATELFIVTTFGLLFEKDTFLQLVTLSLVMAFVLGLFGVLRMKTDPLYEYRDALQHGYDRFNEAI